MSQLGPPYPLIRDALYAGQVIPFLGSGASLGARDPSEEPWSADDPTCLPTAGELASHLADKTVFPEQEARDLTKVAQYYGVVGGRDALRQELHRIFDVDCPPMALHPFLAVVPAPLLIVTTNYDDLVERAFEAQGRDYDLVIHTEEVTSGDKILWWPHGGEALHDVMPNKLDIALDHVTVIYKMHGGVDRHQTGRDQFVISEDDYVDFLTRMTRKRAIPAIFAEPFQTRHFLFLGYGLGDWNLRVVLSRIEKDLRRRKGTKSWAIQYQPSPLEVRFWQERGVEVYDMTIEEFVNALGSA